MCYRPRIMDTSSQARADFTFFFYLFVFLPNPLTFTFEFIPIRIAKLRQCRSDRYLNPLGKAEKYSKTASGIAQVANACQIYDRNQDGYAMIRVCCQR